MLGVQQIIKRNFLQIILNVLNLRTVHMLKYSPQNDDYHILWPEVLCKRSPECTSSPWGFQNFQNMQSMNNVHRYEWIMRLKVKTLNPQP